MSQTPVRQRIISNNSLLTLKIAQATNFSDFRKVFQPKLERLFIVPANTFDNVKGQFPIGFFIWNSQKKEPFKSFTADVYDSKGEPMESKTIHCTDGTAHIGKWLAQYKDKVNQPLGMINSGRLDFQNQKFVHIANEVSDKAHALTLTLTLTNIIPISVFFSVRHCMEATWLNDRDQFLYPDAGWEEDLGFQADCIAYALFHGQNRISAQAWEQLSTTHTGNAGIPISTTHTGNAGIPTSTTHTGSVGVPISTTHTGSAGVPPASPKPNHWIPFTEEEVGAGDLFRSHFMHNFIYGPAKRQRKAAGRQADLFSPTAPETAAPTQEKAAPTIAECFSAEALAVMDAARELWRYYHSQPGAVADASFYDIRARFQGFSPDARGKMKMNNKSADPEYTRLIAGLRAAQKPLAARIAEKVYKYGFLK